MGAADLVPLSILQQTCAFQTDAHVQASMVPSGDMDELGYPMCWATQPDPSTRGMGVPSRRGMARRAKSADRHHVPSIFRRSWLLSLLLRLHQDWGGTADAFLRTGQRRLLWILAHTLFYTNCDSEQAQPGLQAISQQGRLSQSCSGGSSSDEERLDRLGDDDDDDD